MNLPSGESIVRQLVFGQRYFESRFGIAQLGDLDPRRVRLSGDASADLPAGRLRPVRHAEAQLEQAERRSRTPRSGGRASTARGCSPTSRRSTPTTPRSRRPRCATRRRNFKEHGWSNWSLMPFGHGNGGGGPTREMMERARADGRPRRRVADLRRHARASSSVMSRPRSPAGAPVPVWAGELYFEMHRGTLTSQSATKVGNRRCERLLREAELWWAAAGGAPPRDHGGARRAVEGRAAAAVPRHHPRLGDRLGGRRCRGRARTGRRAAGGRSSPTHWPSHRARGHSRSPTRRRTLGAR